MNPYSYEKGITIDGVHSFRDLNLVPADPPVLEEAKVDTKYVDIPGAHGFLDLSESLTGHPVYREREGSFPFYVWGQKSTWMAVRTDVVRRFHGKRAQIIQDREPDVYISGRLSVEDPDRNGSSKIIITGRFEPWKYDMTDSMEDWLWDPFSFDSGVIREYSNISVSGTKVLNFVSSPMSGTPIFYTQDSGLTVTVGGETYTLTAGTNIFPAIILPNDYSVVQMTFSGTGTVSVYYRGGRL